jgi:hypothetical protein
MSSLSHHSTRLYTRIIVASLLMITIVLLGNLAKIYASTSVEFYSPNSPPAGVKSLEPLIAKWWNWWNAVPAAAATNWPQCIKADGAND